MDKADVRSQTTVNLRRVTLTILLEGGTEIPATIWAEQAEQLEDKYRGMESDNIVLIMTSVLIKTYQGAISLSASSGTKFYLNHDFDSATAFRKSFKYDGGCIVNLGDMAEEQSIDNKDSEAQHSINDLWDFISSDVPQDKKFVCKATITEIVSRKGWNYISCSSCSTKLTKSGSSLSCQKCGKSQAVGLLSFRIEVIVDDGEDSATFVIFDEDGAKITGTTAESPISNDKNCESNHEEQEEPTGNLKKKPRIEV
ncbi:uncharacterized protein LOC112089668 [Eutrema salsugineum]|uniref:uncharacterized protein LOC112089668 n=1 Tax=Eutrema salsugineum TaxID=72664 RepID=UPI000CECEA2F|nr:uncharacterized protein LOC112089668 [Eutrema salsugineum]